MAAAPTCKIVRGRQSPMCSATLGISSGKIVPKISAMNSPTKAVRIRSATDCCTETCGALIALISSPAGDQGGWEAGARGLCDSLRDVFDLWAERWRRHEATGDMIIVHDPIAPIVFDDVGLWDSVTRLHDADVDGRTTEHQDPMRLVLPNAVLDDARKTVLRNLETTERGVLHRVALDDSRCSSVDRDPELSSNNDQTLNRDLTPEDLDSGLACIRGVDRRLALPVEGDVIESCLYQDVLPASPLYQEDIAGFQTRQRWSHSASRIAIGSGRFGSDPRGCCEPKTKEDDDRQCLVPRLEHACHTPDGFNRPMIADARPEQHARSKSAVLVRRDDGLGASQQPGKAGCEHGRTEQIRRGSARRRSSRKSARRHAGEF